MAILSTILAVGMGTITAYGFSRFKVKGEADLLFFILSTRMLPPIVVAIPMFLMYRTFDLNDTHIGLIILYTAFNLSFSVWLMKGFIDEIPKEYEEAALVDGYTRLQAFFKIVLPEAATGIAATAVFCFITAWNEYAFALIMTNRRAQTAPPFIPSQIGSGLPEWTVIAAGTFLFLAAGRHLHLPAPQSPAARRDFRSDPQMIRHATAPAHGRDRHGAGHRCALPAVEPLPPQIRADDHHCRIVDVHVHGLVRPERGIVHGQRVRQRRSLMTQIELRGVQKFFGALHVIKDVNLKIDDNEFIVLLGQSGCGKTTTLRAIAGLETIDEGDILIDGKPVQHLQASDRDIAMVFQSFSLYPHMNVYENIAFPLRATRMSKSEVDKEVREIAKVLRITDLLDKKPSALSGGDMQRVAIGRALVRRPKAMLMDEPIGALDAKLREEMRAEIKRLHLKQGSTTIYVTHDQIEAMSLADRIVIMHEGVLQQIGSPEEVYAHPTNLFVARFVGSPVMNVAGVAVTADGSAARVTVEGAADGFAFPGRIAVTARPAQGRQRQSGARHPAGRRAGQPRRGRGLSAGRRGHHRAARRLRHRRPQGRHRRCSGPAPRAAMSRRPATASLPGSIPARRISSTRQAAIRWG